MGKESCTSNDLIFSSLKRLDDLETDLKSKTQILEKKSPERKQPPFLFTSLPDDVIIDIVARVPGCDYLTLSIVSKYFQSLVFSPELYTRRSLLGFTKEEETPKKKLVCGFVVPEARGRSWGNNWLTIFVKGLGASLPRDVMKSALSRHFGSCGEVIRVFVPIECETGARLGFAFINMKDENDIEKVLTLNGSDLGGRKLEVMMAKDRDEYYGYPYPNFKGCGICRCRKVMLRQSERFYRKTRLIIPDDE